MPDHSRLDQLQLKVLTKAVSLVMAPPNARQEFDQFPMTVSRVVDLAPQVKRITFRADGFQNFELTGPDEYFALLMPPAGRTGVIMPSGERINVRQAIRRLPEADRPELRWYTVRALRAQAGEIDVDFVLHGDSGPGSRWASAAAPGDMAGFRAGGSAYRQPGGRGAQLLVADEIALPALASILESHGPDAGNVHVFVELPSEDYRQPIVSSTSVTWLHRGAGAPGSRVIAAIGHAGLPPLEYAWICGESALVSGVRRYLVRERGMDRRRITFSGYWKLGQVGHVITRRDAETGRPAVSEPSG